ncbi:hypothetical protein ACIRU3_25855 [Streptomyces sp. NPDC101151]|uniref:hypothetical protein n=1 Tax=Streptomyces sp. NPDC101151 TaxID=3366115 RepID=UPI003812250A
MTRTRTVRLPADVPMSAVSVDGTQLGVRQEDNGTTRVEFTGILRVNGRPVLSPGQLLTLWSGRAGIEYEVADATLRPDDAMPPSDKARYSAYSAGAGIAHKAREQGHGDDKIPLVLEEMRKQFAAQGPAHGIPATAYGRATAREMDIIIKEMIAAWQQALAFEWISDD